MLPKNEATANELCRASRMAKRVSATILALGAALLLALAAWLGLPGWLIGWVSAEGNGSLTVEIIAGYNLVVDSNVKATSTYAPSVATVIGKFCNTSGSQTLNNVWGYIGDHTFAGNGTPGVYPARDSSMFGTSHPLYNSGIYSFTHVGGRLGLADASRYIGTLAPNECKAQYWHFTYPRCEGNQSPPCSQDAVWGDSVKPDDDLWLTFDMWGTAAGGIYVAETWTMTMRNEISAMANKIEPNPNGQWFNTNSTVVKPGDVITSNGILYELGVINQGFDNDGDFVPDFNAWLQPVGDPSYDPSCFRLIRASGRFTVTRGGGNPDTVLLFRDNLYFTNLPDDNTGARGLVYYSFLALNGPCSTNMSPYQEVASGRDNEKFNGDYGVGIPPIGSSTPDVTIDKSGNVTVLPGQIITYAVKSTNKSSDTSAGLPAYNMALVLSDTIPANTTFVTNSIVTDSGSTILYSTDGGTTWTETQPVSGVTNIQVWSSNPLAPSASTTFTFTVRVTPTLPAGTKPVIENCAGASFGRSAPFGGDCMTTIVQGSLSLGNETWRDDNRDGVHTATEPHIGGVTVTLYYDANGNGQLDSGDQYLTSMKTDASGYYTFSNLYTGTYLSVVNPNSLPASYLGYRLTTVGVYSVNLTAGVNPYVTADFGFGPSLTVNKSFPGGVQDDNGLVNYIISVANLRPSTGQNVEGGKCLVETWATSGNTGASPKNFLTPDLAYNNASGPDGNYASADFATGANKWITATGFATPTLSAAIQNVKVVVPGYVYPALVNDDVTPVTLYSGTNALSATTFSTQMLNQFVGAANSGVWEWDVTSVVGTWNLAMFKNLTVQVDQKKNNGADNTILYVDAFGFDVTFNQACPAANLNDIMTTVPLTDTYDTARLQFVSAVPPHTSVNTTTGVITWTNVGPIVPGDRAQVVVTFRAPDVNSATPITNNTCSIGTTFSNGGYANNDCKTAYGTITPTGFISGVVWSDVAPTGWQGTQPSPGFTSADYRIPAVQATLLRCEWNDYSGIVPVPAPDNNKTCAQQSKSGGINGTWVTVTTRSTDASGYYEFTGLPDAYYIVRLSPGTLPSGFGRTAEPTNAANGAGITCGTCDDQWGSTSDNLRGSGTLISPVQSASAITQVNFGYSGNAALYGTVWHDYNGDSVRQSGDSGIGVVTVTLRNITGTIVATTTTNATGYYSFTGLVSGTYTIAVVSTTLPAGGSWTQTFDPDASCPGNGCNDQHTVTVNTGQISGSHDFSYHQRGTLTIGDRVYYDWDGNGDLGSSDEGIPIVTLTLYRDNGNNTFDSSDMFVMTTTTSVTGYYLFTELPASATVVTYFVVVETTGPYFPTRVNQTADPDERPGVCNVCNSRGKVGLTTVSTDTLDFGYRPYGSGAIGDTVYRDMNGDGQQAGPLETGIASVLVTLTVDLNGDGNFVPVMTRTTDANGYYLFTDLSAILLPAGSYRVLVDSSSPNLPTDAFGNQYILSTPISHTKAITYAETYLQADFGFMPLGAIGDTIYWDNDGNGSQTGAESGIPGIVVTLTNMSVITLSNGTGYQPGAYVLTRTTSGTGYYIFSSLVSGTYSVTVGPITDTPKLTGDPDAYVVPCDGVNSGLSCDGMSRATIRPGVINLGQDFGYQPYGVIGNYVWIDVDGDGRQDSGEPGIQGVTITVGNGSQTFTTTTDSDGYYSFGNLGNGTWTVRFITPTNMTPTVSSTNAYTQGVGSVGTSITVTISGGQVTEIGGNGCSNCSLYIDSGFRPNGSLSLSGHVFYDASGPAVTNDYYDPLSDTAYSNITAYLYDSDRRLIGTTTTDASGIYTFTGLVASSVYTVAVDSTSPRLNGMTLSAVGGYEVRTYHTVPLAGADITNVDFGFYQQVDFGDLLDTYHTTLANEGAGHISGSLRLGSLWDAESNGQPNGDATGDGSDEDGVARNMGQNWAAGNPASLFITVTGNNGYLVGWFDWDNSGGFTGTNEVIIFGSVVSGTNQLTFTVGSNFNPASSNPYYLRVRFRLYDEATFSSASPTGLVTSGEVEDYRWQFGPTAVTLDSLTAHSTSGASLSLVLVLLLVVVMVLGGLKLAVVWRRV